MSRALVSSTWNLPSYGRFRVVEATDQMLTQVDRIWPPARPPHYDNCHWEWFTLTRKKSRPFSERFAVVSTDNNDVVALWAGKNSTPRIFADGKYYRLDLFEISPIFRRQISDRVRPFSGFCFSLIGCRALEVQADHVVFGASPNPKVVKFYTDMGGVKRTPPGWQVEHGLLTIVVDPDPLQDLKELADDVLEEGAEVEGV